MWWVYEALLVIALAAYLPKALWRRRLPHRGWRMRLGRYPNRVTAPLEGHRPVWVHAVSVGEVQAARPLVHALTGVVHGPIVLSTVTPSGFEVASRQGTEPVLPIYLPLDLRGCVRRAFDAIHPRALILVESELWPTVIRVAKQRGIPVVVVNGRISPRTFRRAQWLTPWLRGLLTQVDGFLMQSELDAERIIACGAPRAAVQVTGSLKWEASLAARPSPEVIREIAQRLGLNGQEAVIVAGSTHRGEEAALLNAFRALRGTHPSARLIVAPRHLERLSEVEGLIQKTGFTPTRLSHLSAVPAVTGQAEASRGTPWNVGLVDTFGQLPRYYGLATVAFIGGSLIPHGGQNPLEAASLGKPIVFGPSMHNFPDIARQLTTAQAARQLAGASDLVVALQDLLRDPATAQAMGRRAQALTERSRGALQRTLDVLRPLIAAT